MQQCSERATFRERSEQRANQNTPRTVGREAPGYEVLINQSELKTKTTSSNRFVGRVKRKVISSLFFISVIAACNRNDK